jgi:serine protease
MASPHVASAAALLVSLGVTDPQAVEGALKRSARVVDGSEDGKKLYGAGILQVANAVEQVSLIHVLARLGALLAVTLLVARGVRKKKGPSIARWGAGYWFFALAAGPGVFFFAPWVLPRVPLAVDILARPFADYDLLLGPSVHGWLPLTSCLLPFAMTAVAFGAKKLRPSIAGFASGTAAYLLAVPALREMACPLGFGALCLYVAVNVAVCIWIARTNLRETQ